MTAAAPESPAAAQPVPVPATPASAPPPQAMQAAAPRPAAPYMAPELKRIGILAVLMLVILGVLTAVLR